MRRPNQVSLSPNDQAVHAKWLRGVAVLYVSIAAAMIGFGALDQMSRADDRNAMRASVAGQDSGLGDRPLDSGRDPQREAAMPTGDVWPVVDRRTATPTTAPASERPGDAGPDIRALLADPAIRDFVGLSENAWDFAAPDGVPGFGALPGTPSRPNEVANKAPNGRAPHP